ncbi:MAG: DUF1641 domain-containing protein [Acidimicrobiales bacterium]
MTSTEMHSTESQPMDAVRERMNDPAVAASLVTLLDNAELLSTLVLGLSGLVGRGEMIMDSVAEGVHDFKASGGTIRPEGVPSMQEIGALTAQLADATPLIADALNSSIARPETIDFLAMLSEAANDGVKAANSKPFEKRGIIGLSKVLREDEVQRGLDMFIEIARSLGRHLDARASG